MTYFKGGISKLLIMLLVVMLLAPMDHSTFAAPLTPGNIIPEMTSNTAPKGLARASSSEYPAYLAFNHKDAKDAWVSGRGRLTGWLEYTFDGFAIVNKYTVRTQNLAGYGPARAPRDFNFEAWEPSLNNGVGDWVILDSRRNITGWQPGVAKEFTFQNTKGYNKYRINILTNNGDSQFITIGELEMMEIIPTVAPVLTGGIANRLSWNTVPGATSYTIKRATVSGGPYTTIATNVMGNSFNDNTVIDGTTYYYVITGVNFSGESPASNVIALTPKAPEPAYSPISFGLFESAINNGSISGTYTLALPQGTFVGDVASGLTVNGLPVGLRASVSPFNNSVVLVNFTGQATRHTSADSVYNVSIKVKKENISGASADFTTAPFAIVFKDNVPVPPTITPPADFLDFDGVDDTVKATDLRVNTLPGGKNTVEFWMYAEGRSVRMPFGWNTKYDLAFGANSFGFNTGESNNIVGISSEGLYDKWVHVAAVFTNDTPSPSNMELYINGVKQTLSLREGPAPSSPRTVTSTVYMSGYGDRTTNKFDGKLADVRIWNYARTQDEILAGLYGTITGNEPGLVGYWKLGNLTTGKAYDFATDRHHGIGYGFTTPQLNLQATGVTANQATLVWNAIDGADKYMLKRNGVFVYEGANPSFVDTGLAASIVYTYTVTAVNGKGESMTSQLPVTTSN